MRTYWVPFLYAFIINFFQVLLEISIPFVLKEIIEFLQSSGDGKKPIEHGIIFIGIYLLIDLVSKLLSQQGNYLQGLLGAKAYTGAVALCYNKILRLSSATNKAFTQGEIINFIQVDAAKIEFLAWVFPTVSRLPILLVFAITFLVYYLGYSLFAAFGVAFFLVFVNFFIAVFEQRIQKVMLERKDKRMRYTTELINSIKIIKLNSWATYFIDKVNQSRIKEVVSMIWVFIIDLFNVLVIFTLSPALVLASFGVFFATGHTMSLANGFACLQVMNSLNMPIRWIPQFVGVLLKFMVSMRRIQAFLNCDEVNPQIVETHFKDIMDKDIDVEILNANFSWGGKLDDIKSKEDKKKDEESKKKENESTPAINESLVKSTNSDPNSDEQDDGQKSTSDSDNDEKKIINVSDSIQIKDMNLRIHKGEFICIIGGVGSGKSSLISALLGDMIYMDDLIIDEYKDKKMDDACRHEIVEKAKMHKSIVKLGGSVSLVQQIPWIQNKTIRDNILFGLPMNEERYNRTIELCELGADLEILTGGDLTEIGEKGINLSGGQKARVSLARAVYSNTDIILMDDPISALDTNVKQKIFENLFLKELKHKTRILVTHAVEFIQKVDRIIIMEKGQIKYFGTYEELQHSDEIKHIVETLSQISVKQHSNEEEKDKENDEAEEDKIEDVKKSFISNNEAKIVSDENEEKIEVDWNIYYQFFLTKYTWIFYVILIPLSFVSSFLMVENNIVLGKWINVGNEKEHYWKYFLQVLFLSLGSGFLTSLVTFGISIATIRIAKLLHENMIKKTVDAPINLYFDKTPSGRILNRFSSDISKIDCGIDAKITWCVNCYIMAIFDIYVAALNTPWVLATMPFIITFLVILLRFYIKTFREINRIRSVSRSPLLTHLGETINGTSTIRAFKLENDFINTNYKLLSTLTNVEFWGEALRSWFAIRIEFVSLFVLGFTSGFLVYYRDTNDPILAGVLFNQFIMFNFLLLWGCQLLTDLEGDFVSYHRCVKMLEIPQEAEQRIDMPHLKHWPTEGAIEFKNYSLRYRPETDLVLKNLNFAVQSREKIGIVGRTGAGKSTICLGLCRIVEADTGTIMIDGVDINTLGLADLREKITIIPQDPTLFEGSLRFNLDPVGKLTDSELLRMAKKASLENLINRDEKGLNQEIEDGGKNLSSGEKQLICICRAILRKNRVVLMDEATANIDIKTEQTIQKLINEEFVDSTVLTIAHRLNTIINSDKVLVLSQGQVVEFDDPQRLLANSDSMFYSYAKELKKKEK